MQDLKNAASNLAVKYRTESLPPHSRREWMREMIAREYTKIEVSAPSNVQLLDETTIYPWEQLRLSTVRSNGIQLDRLKMEPYSDHHDNYLAVLLLSGRYRLEQDGREVFLKPGELTVYDATKPHHIHCPEAFSKVIVTIPRRVMRERLPGVELCTARKVSNERGIGLMASHFIGSVSHQLDAIDIATFNGLSAQALDFLTMSFAAIRPQHFELSRSRSVTLHQVKMFVAQHLSDANLNPAKVAAATGLSTRYINMLFDDENTALMRYVLEMRLKRCYEDLVKAKQVVRVSDVAYKWGFNDMSHFSRNFKQAFGTTATDVMRANIGH